MTDNKKEIKANQARERELEQQRAAEGGAAGEHDAPTIFEGAAEEEDDVVF